MTGASDPDPVAELTAELAEGIPEMARFLSGAESMALAMERMIALAVEAIEGCDFAGIFMVQDRALTMPAASGTADEVDRLQQSLGEGPCLDAIASASTIYAADLDGDTRWPQFAPAAVTMGVRSALALSLRDSLEGALNLYGAYPEAFGIVDRAKAAMLATLATMTIVSLKQHESDTLRSDNLEVALATRALIGQAQGILMERERITSEQAFAVLRRASMHLNIKLRDVAQRLVDTGELPSREPRQD